MVNNEKVMMNQGISALIVILILRYSSKEKRSFWSMYSDCFFLIIGLLLPYEKCVMADKSALCLINVNLSYCAFNRYLKALHTLVTADNAKRGLLFDDFPGPVIVIFTDMIVVSQPYPVT